MSQEFYNKDDDKVIDIDMEKLKKAYWSYYTICNYSNISCNNSYWKCLYNRYERRWCGS